MAGEGKRFQEAGYLLPKPFIDMNGSTMIARVMRSITPSQPHRWTLLDRAAVGRTEGAIDTLLHAQATVPAHHPVLVANCDQIIDTSIDHFIWCCTPHVGVMTFTSQNPAHSYVQTDDIGWMTNIAEKEVISSRAVVGVYYFPTALLLFDYCQRVMDAGTDRLNGEYYLSAALKLMLEDKVPMVGVHTDPGTVHMVGTPEQMEDYLKGHPCRDS